MGIPNSSHKKRLVTSISKSLPHEILPQVCFICFGKSPLIRMYLNGYMVDDEICVVTHIKAFPAGTKGCNGNLAASTF